MTSEFWNENGPDLAVVAIAAAVAGIVVLYMRYCQ